MIIQLGLLVGIYTCLFSSQVIVNGVEKIPEIKNSDTQASSKNATAIALQNCEKYAEYRYVKKWIPAMADKPGYWYNTTDCVNVLPLIIGGTATKPKEYPHMAHIGFAKDNDFKNVRWNCGGSLISEKFILSTAVCGQGSSSLKPRWVSLGDLNLSSTSDDPKPAIYEIVKVYNHPNYDPKISLNDISLFELNSSVVMSPYVRPACLYTSTANLVNTRGSITGWGKTANYGNSSNELLKATITVLEDQKCSELYDKLSANSGTRFDPNSMICAGDLKDGKDSCQGDSGGPLQMPIQDQTCMWNIFGLVSYGRGCGDPKYPAVYTKVAHYVDWIQSIVWP